MLLTVSHKYAFTITFENAYVENVLSILMCANSYLSISVLRENIELHCAHSFEVSMLVLQQKL